MLMAISSGVSLPMSSPTGAWMRSIVSREAFLSEEGEYPVDLLPAAHQPDEGERQGRDAE